MEICEYIAYIIPWCPWGQDYKEKHKTRLKTNVNRTVLNNTKLRHFWAQIVSWAPIHVRKTFIILAPSTDCELSTNPCSKNGYNLGPRCVQRLPQSGIRILSTLVQGSGSFELSGSAGLGYGLGLGLCVLLTIIVSLNLTHP